MVGTEGRCSKRWLVCGGRGVNSTMGIIMPGMPQVEHGTAHTSVLLAHPTRMQAAVTASTLPQRHLCTHS